MTKTMDHKQRNYDLDAFKVLAFLLMCFDHAAHIGKADWLWRVPGRVVLPMFAVMLAYKAYHYSGGGMVRRLLLWGVIAQLPLMLVGWQTLNILFTLAAGLFVAERIGRQRSAALFTLLAIAIAELALRQTIFEYGVAGVLFVLYCCWAQARPQRWFVAALCLLCTTSLFTYQAVALLGLACSVAYIHRDQAFAWVQRVPTTAWYALYPAHILVIWGLLQCI